MSLYAYVYVCAYIYIYIIPSVRMCVYIYIYARAGGYKEAGGGKARGGRCQPATVQLERVSSGHNNLSSARYAVTARW